MTSIASGQRTGIARPLTLRTALKLDGAVTGANGAAYLLAAVPLGELFGMSPDLLRVLGVLLAGFAAAVWLTATRPTIPRLPTVAIITVNAAWALASIAVAIGDVTSPTTVGAVWIVGQAVVVAGFAALQGVALCRR